MSIGEHSPTVVPLTNQILDRMVLAVENVRKRLLRSTAALEAANISYAVIEGNAVAALVSKIDAGAARNTVDVDLMINRADLTVPRPRWAARDSCTVSCSACTCFWMDQPGGRATPFTFSPRAKRCGLIMPSLLPTL